MRTAERLAPARDPIDSIAVAIAHALARQHHGQRDPSRAKVPEEAPDDR